MYHIPRAVRVGSPTPALAVLLLERAPWPGYWQSVTGSVAREAEPLGETAAREVREETGIDAT
ncbi:MAG: NUDIX domain-containing protein, partial [Burkholderiales bacterium]